jgi:hypothetical protein
VLDLHQRVFATGKPVFTNLYKGTRSGLYVFGVLMPVFRGDRVVYSLEFVVHANDFAKLLSQQNIPPEWIVGIVDANNLIVARNRLPEEYVGRTAVPTIAKELTGSEEGSLEHRNIEGVETIAIFHRSPKTGWSVMSGVPKAAMLADIRQWLWWTVGGALLLSMMGIALALYLARQISGSIRSLVAPALALGSGEPAQIGHQPHGNERGRRIPGKSIAAPAATHGGARAG